jgi:hypothetical protein
MSVHSECLAKVVNGMVTTGHDTRALADSTIHQRCTARTTREKALGVELEVSRTRNELVHFPEAHISKEDVCPARVLQRVWTE